MAQSTSPYDAPKATVVQAGEETQPVRIFSVSGRIGRVRYIAYGLAFLVIAMIAHIGGMINQGAGRESGTVVLAVLAALLVLGLMLTIQRCHDFNASGWLSLLGFLPIVNLVFWFTPGTTGPNRYGFPTPPNGAVTIGALCAAPLVVVFLGAIANNIFNDLGGTAHVSAALGSAQPWRRAIEGHYAATGKLPASTDELREASAVPSAEPYTITLGANGMLTVTFPAHVFSAEQNTVELQPRASGNVLSWDCAGGTVPSRYRPRACRVR